MPKLYIPNTYKFTDLFQRFCFKVLEQEQGRMKAVHAGLYMYIVNLNRKLKWNRKFGLPTKDAMKFLGIKSDDTYYKLRNELIGFGLMEMLEPSTSKNQSSVFTLHTKRLKEFSRAEWLKEIWGDKTSADFQPKSDTEAQNCSKKSH